MKYVNRLFCLITILTIILTGCSSAPDSGAGKRDDGKIFIGFSMDTLKEERWTRDKLHFEERCKELNVQCEITVADNSEERQANQVDNLLTKGIDVLVIAPHNAQQAASIVEKAKAQGVPVISYDRLINSDSVDLYVSHQVTRIGRMQAEYALKKAPKGNYIMVYGASTDKNAIFLKEAQLEVLKPAIEKGDIKIVAEQHATDWKREEALKIVENALTQNKNDVAAVVASNDGTASGAIQALKAQNLAGKVIVTGQDADLVALQSIAAGEQTMTIYKPIKPLAYSAVDAAIKLAKREKVETNAAIKAVNKEIPSLLQDPIVVDKDNIMQTVIKDGYQKYEDVYKNVPADKRPKQ
jgi:D-xylose transport system substrate-binding protein